MVSIRLDWWEQKGAGTAKSRSAGCAEGTESKSGERAVLYGMPEALQEDKGEIRKAEDMTTPWLLTFLLLNISLLASPLDYFVKGKDGRWG